MMPATVHQIRGGMTIPLKRGDVQREFKPAAEVLIFTCEGCGRPAGHGVGVNIRAALATVDMSKAGKWYCGLVEGRPACLLRPEAPVFISSLSFEAQKMNMPAAPVDLFGGAP